jgi:hypothetical protein
MDVPSFCLQEDDFAEKKYSSGLRCGDGKLRPNVLCEAYPQLGPAICQQNGSHIHRVHELSNQYLFCFRNRSPSSETRMNHFQFSNFLATDQLRVDELLPHGSYDVICVYSES